MTTRCKQPVPQVVGKANLSGGFGKMVWQSASLNREFYDHRNFSARLMQFTKVRIFLAQSSIGFDSGNRQRRETFVQKQVVEIKANEKRVRKEIRVYLVGGVRLTLGRERSFCALQLTCSRVPSGQTL